MIVFSPLSLYTTYLGWQHYDVLFNALWQTGLLYLGFLMLAYRYLKNVLAPAGSTHQAADYALNCFLYELAVIFFICAIFVYPSVNLEQKGLMFKPICSMKKGEELKDSTLKNSGTTFDETFADVLTDHVKIPLGFSIIQSLASSFTYGVMKVTGCTDSLQAIQGDLISTYIPEELREQALLFHKQCFLEARSSYLNETHTETEQTKVNDILKHRGGDEDLKWLGSKTFQSLYYSKLYAREPVKGFPYEKHPNPYFENAKKTDKTLEAHLPVNGYPSCQQWWNSLQKELVSLPEKAGLFDSHLGSLNVAKRVRNYKEKHELSWHSDISAEEYIAKVLLADSRDLQIRSNEALMDPTNNSATSFISRSLVNAGGAVKSWTTTALKREAIMQTLPIMQAFFYFFLIVFTPLILALSGYSPRALGSLCALFFMSIFVQCIWHYAGFLERAAIDVLGENDVVAAMRNTAVMIYFIAPVLLLKLSAHFGGDAGAGLAEFMGGGEASAKETAETGASAVKMGGKLALTLAARR